MKLRITFFFFVCALFNAGIMFSQSITSCDSVSATKFPRTSDAFRKVIEDIIEVDDYQQFDAEYYSDILTLFKWKPNRDIVCVCFENSPSEQDFIDDKENMLIVQPYFRNYGLDTLKNIKQILNRTGLVYEQTEYTLATIPEQYRDFAFGKTAKKGAYTEIKQIGNTYSMARIIRCNYSSADSVRLKISLADDSVDFVQKEWMRINDLPNDLKKSIDNTPVGRSFTYTNPSGVMIEYTVDSLATPTRKVELAELKVEVRPSSTTHRANYNLAKLFSDVCYNEEDFYSAAQSEGLTVLPLADLLNALPRPKRNVSVIEPAGFSELCKIIRWAYKAENVGAVSEVFDVGNYYTNCFIVALVVENDKR